MSEIIRPNGHEEMHCPLGCFTIRKYEDESKCGKGENIGYPYAKNMTFNDEYITYTDEHGAGCVISLKGWILTVIPKNIVLTSEKHQKKEELPELDQMSIFDFL